MRRAIGVLMLMTSVAGCASMGVETEHSRGVDFSDFSTFRYEESSMSIADTNPTAHARIVEAIKRELTANGLSEAHLYPELYVTYYADTTKDTTVDSSELDYSANSQFYLTGTLRQATSIRSFDRGTIVVDLWNAESHELIWRGQVQKYLGRNPDAQLDKIDEGIARIFRDFPPAP